MFTHEFPDNLVPGAYEFLKPQTEEAARSAVVGLYERGYRQIKIIQDDSRLWAGEQRTSPQLTPPIFNGLVDEAKGLGMRVYVHSTQLEVTRAAVLAGIDAFMHGTMDAQVDSSLFERMAAEGIAWTPTHVVLLQFGDYRRYARRVLADERLRASLSATELSAHQRDAIANSPIRHEAFSVLTEHLDQYIAAVSANTRRAQEAGVVVAIGSDGGPAGTGGHLEMELLYEGGLSPEQVIVAATSGGARALGLQDQLGTLDPGMFADLLVLTANPLADVRNTRQIEWVLKGGVLFDARRLSASSDE
jgi:imidazolonepropionase-like amidohydrolase